VGCGEKRVGGECDEKGNGKREIARVAMGVLSFVDKHKENLYVLI
jgi:hypothetical protein